MPGDLRGYDRLAVVDARVPRVQATRDLPGGVAYHSLARGSRIGRLYLFGFRALGRFGSSPADAIVTVLNPGSYSIRANWVARKAAGHDWFPYQGLISRDEKQLFISYHGPDTTGVDRFTVSNNQLRRCRPAKPRPLAACMTAHGGIELFQNKLLASLGQGAIVEFSTDGNPQRKRDTHLEGNHLLEFALRASAGQLLAVGSRVYAGGYSELDIATGGIKALVRPPDYHVCGERLAVAPDGILLVAKTGGVLPQQAQPGSVLFLDPRGRVLHATRTPSEVVDVLVPPQPRTGRGE